MKKFVVLSLLALVGVYLVGFLKLGTSGAMDFLIRMENLTNDGKAAEVCDMFHEDLEVKISDHTTRKAREIQGGKDELCDVTHESVDALAKVPHTMHVEWNDIEVKRSWLHPWTSEVSYSEERAMTLRGMNMRIDTTSQDTIILVQTLSGVKLRKLDAEAWLSD